MQEKRKYRRLELHVSVKLEAMDDSVPEDEKEFGVNVTDLSSGGIGFESPVKLKRGEYYNTQMEIWTKEVISCIIETVREVERDGVYHYGAIFIGMNDIDKRKIYVYQLIDEIESEKNE